MQRSFFAFFMGTFSLAKSNYDQRQVIVVIVKSLYYLLAVTPLVKVDNKISHCEIPIPLANRSDRLYGWCRKRREWQGRSSRQCVKTDLNAAAAVAAPACAAVLEGRALCQLTQSKNAARHHYNSAAALTSRTPGAPK